MTNDLVATVKPWNVEAFHRHAPDLAGDWHLVSSPKQLAPAVEGLHPGWVFFPHWSWKVPAGLIDGTECVCFHMTDVPYGRGGSPLQNLIARGHRETMLSAPDGRGARRGRVESHQLHPDAGCTNLSPGVPQAWTLPRIEFSDAQPSEDGVTGRFRARLAEDEND